MDKISFATRLETLCALGDYWRQGKDNFKELLARAYGVNNWFTPANSWAAMESISQQWLNKAELEKFCAAYPLCQDDSHETATVGLVMAGNVPLVGLHDLVCGWLAGAKLRVKLSEKDSVLMRAAIEFIWQHCPQAAEDSLQIVEKLKNYDRVIATGSDNSSVYFEQYFGHVPRLIRKNRNSVAILNGQETESELMSLGMDIFRYFGLGCRSVAKLYLPQGYDIPNLLRILDNYKDICNHTKYVNNFDYNRSIFLLNNETHYLNDCLVLLESKSFQSRIATLNYEFYPNVDDLVATLKDNLPSLQCIAANFDINGIETVRLGDTQKPRLMDFADGVDTMQFLLGD